MDNFLHFGQLFIPTSGHTVGNVGERYFKGFAKGRQAVRKEGGGGGRHYAPTFGQENIGFSKPTLKVLFNCRRKRVITVTDSRRAHVT